MAIQFPEEHNLLIQKIAKVLDEVRGSRAPYIRKLKDLSALRSSTPLSQFFPAFTKTLTPIFTTQRRIASVERIVQFVAVFACLRGVNKSEDCDEFFQQFLRFLIAGSTATSRTARFRACQIISERFLATMRAIKGALIVASSVQIILGYSQLWVICSRFFSPVGMVPVIALTGFGLFDQGFPVIGRCVEFGIPMLILFVMFSQYLKQFQAKQLPILERFALLLTIVVIWAYAHLLTASGAYKHHPEQTQMHCRTDKADLISAAPWRCFIKYNIDSSWLQAQTGPGFEAATKYQLWFKREWETHSQKETSKLSFTFKLVLL